MSQLELGMQLKKQGMQQAADAHYNSLRFARGIAKNIARSRPSRTVSVDDVQHRLALDGIDLGNAAGAIFKEPCWQFLEYRRSTRPSAHARVVGVWQLLG